MGEKKKKFCPILQNNCFGKGCVAYRGEEIDETKGHDRYQPPYCAALKCSILKDVK